MERIPKTGEFYWRDKDKLYQVIAVAKHAETGERMVVYQALYGDYGIYAKPLSLFLNEAEQGSFEKATVPEEGVREQSGIYKQTDGHEQSGIHEQVEGYEKSKVREPVIGREKNGLHESVRGHEKSGIRMQADGYEQPRVHERSEGREQSEVHKQTGLHEQTEEHKQSSPVPDMLMQSPTVAHEEHDQNTQDQNTHEQKTRDRTTSTQLPPNDLPSLSPLLLPFVEAETYDQRLEILTAMRGRIGQEELDVLYVALDLPERGGTVEEQLASIENYLQMQKKFDGNRLR